MVGDDPNGNSIINHNSQMVSQKFVLIKKSFLQRDSYKKLILTKKTDPYKRTDSYKKEILLHEIIFP